MSALAVSLRFHLLALVACLLSSLPATAVGAEPTPVETLVAEFGYTEDALDELPDVEVAAAHTLDMRASTTTRRAEIEPSRALLTERVRLLTEFANEPDLIVEERGPRVFRLAIALAKIASTEAEVASLDKAAASFDKESALLGDVLSSLEESVDQTDAEREHEAARQKSLAEEEAAARAAADEARRREEATKDAALKQLYARERELREELLGIATARRQDTEIGDRTSSLTQEFTAKKGEVLGAVDALPAEPTTEARRSTVDPLLRDILRERRRMWAMLEQARRDESAAHDEVSELEDQVEAAQAKLAGEKARERELGGGELWKQRVKVAETELELLRSRLEAASEREAQAASLVSLLEDGVEFFSKELRLIIDRASGEGRREVYGIFNDDALSDAWQRLNDRYYGARRLFESRAEEGRSLGDQWLALTVWLGGLVWRLFLALLLLMSLRFVPPITRRVLDFLQNRKFFRRRPSAAIKIFELLRSTARPALLYAGAIYVTAYVIESLPELIFVRWGIDAFFAYFIGVRVAVTIALPRWYGEREGLAAAGTEDDLRPDEAAIADVLRLDLDRGTKLVRSARIVLFVGTIWYFAPAIVVAITGVSVLSGLITTATRAAIGVVVYWMLWTWRDELSRLFTRLAGNRIPKATTFVERNKDRPWGVLVVAFVSVVVLVWELVKFVRGSLRDTDWFKQASAYAFKTKIELQQREPTEAEVRAFLPDDLEEGFSTEMSSEDVLVERESMNTLRETFDGFVERGHGAMVLVGEPGIGKTTVCDWLIGDREVIRLHPTQRVVGTAALIALFDEHFGRVSSNFADIAEHIEEMPPTIFLLDGLEYLFLRDIDGYGAYQSFMDLIHRLSRKHIWLVTSNRFAWEFLTRVYDQRHVFQDVSPIPRWTDEELRDLIERRMAKLPYTTSFSDLADLDGTDSTEVVKTARGYYRYLAEFTRGLPSAAMHYWLRSLSGGAKKTYSVGLFTRPSGATLVAAPPQYRFILAAITQHARLTPAEAARVANTPVGTCELASRYFADIGAIEGDVDAGYELASPFLSLTLRHLEDSNLL